MANSQVLLDRPVSGSVSSATLEAGGVRAGLLTNRWVQLGLGLVCMLMISSPQYVWALLTESLGATLNVGLAQLQVTFSLLIVVQTFLSPAQGVLVDRFGPRVLLSVGAALTGLSWVLASMAANVFWLYATYGVLGGLGTGIVYIGVVGHMVQWFPDKRGLATGLVAAGYGMGALMFTFPVAEMVSRGGHTGALQLFGMVFGVVGALAAQGLRQPSTAVVQSARAAGAHAGLDVRPGAMLRTPVFWLLFIMMSMMSTSGLMVISQMGAFTTDFGMAKVMVWGMPLLPLALSVDRLTNGLTRPFFGWVSDRIGRENTMFIAFALEAAAMTAWLLTRDNPVLFVLLSGVVFFGWGEIFSLFPSTLTDTFGTRHATTNYGFLYMAQGIGSVLGGPVAAMLHDATGSWLPVFAVIIGIDTAAAVLALLVLKPLRARWMARHLTTVTASLPS